MRYLTALLLLLIPFSVLAYDTARVGGTYLVVDEVVSAAAAECLTEGEGSAVCLLFPAGSGEAHGEKVSIFKLVNASSAVVGCVWSTGFENTSFDLAGTVETASGPTGGFKLTTTADVVFEQPDWTELNTGPGSVSSICADPITSGRESIYLPCGDTADCSARGAGLCHDDSTDALKITSLQKSLVGVFLVCQCSSGTTDCTVTSRKQKVKKY